MAAYDYTKYEDGILVRQADGLYTKEYCDLQLRKLRDAEQVLREEYKANLQIIKDKVKGQIRIAQRRNKDIKEEVAGLRFCADPWRNAGIW
jgi:hypothetical protein